ncbi:unnamed protein product [Ostreobium quekettii]|uniref:F-box domain-containing protein n=1 Tax=Ostreobium quekettii TaxID=121088 RepID=A0A8S1JDX0_9CHLO|nr:unnamed protein product [Ostreobium quekettii]
MAEPQRQAGLCDLPDACLEAVLAFLPPVDLLSFQGACRRFRDVGRSPSLWIRKLRCDYGLRAAPERGSSHLEPQRLYQSLACQPQAAPLRFTGLLTDGGVDEGHPAFWCGNMFEGERARCYSSEMHRNRDVRVAAGLLSDVPASPRPFPSPLDRPPVRQPLRQEPTLATWPGGSGPAIYDRRAMEGWASSDPRATAIVQAVAVSREGRLTCPVRCGAVFLANTSNAMGVEELYGATRGRWVDAMAGLGSCDAVIAAAGSGSLPRAAERRASTHGEWVEFDHPDGYRLGEFRPVVWFRFFSREEARLARRASWEERAPAEEGPPAAACTSPVQGLQTGHPSQTARHPPCLPAEIPDLSPLASASSGGMSSDASGDPPAASRPLDGPSNERNRDAGPSAGEAWAGRAVFAASPRGAAEPSGASTSGHSQAIDRDQAAVLPPGLDGLDEDLFPDAIASLVGFGGGSAVVERAGGGAGAGPSAAAQDDDVGSATASDGASAPSAITLWPGHEADMGSDSDDDWNVDLDVEDDPFALLWGPQVGARPEDFGRVCVAAFFGRSILFVVAVTMASPRLLIITANRR